MSVIQSTPTQISHSPLNTSRSKQLFSFSKAPRFADCQKRLYFLINNIFSCDNFYDIPSSRMKRATSFGYGNRCLISRNGVSPPPNQYKLPASFDTKTLAGLRYTFGTAREAYAKVYMKANPPKDPAVPGPGTYNVRSAPGKDTSKYSFRPKTSNNCIYLD